MAIYAAGMMWMLAFTYLAKSTKKQKKLVMIILSAILPVCIAGFRYNNGADYLMYARIFRLWSAGYEVNTVKTLEIGYEILNKVCAVLSDSYVLMFFAVAAVIVFFYTAGCWRLSENILFSILLFFLTGTYLDTFNGIRQYMAAAIVFFAFRFYMEGSLKKYVLWVLAGGLFHYTAFAMLLLYFLRFIKLDVKKTITLILSVFLFGNGFYLFFTQLLRYTRYQFYLRGPEYEAAPVEAAMVYISVTGILSLLIYQFKREKDDEFQKMFNIHIVTWVIVISSMYIPMIHRVLYYFLPFEMIFIPSLVARVNGRYCRLLLSIGFCVMYLAIVGYGIYVRGWYDCLPYHFVFDYV